jgi:hypothetical protein
LQKDCFCIFKSFGSVSYRLHRLAVRLRLLLLASAGVLTFIVFTPTPVAAATISSTATGGLWNAPTTWSGGVVPGPGDTVTIDSGATVTVNIPGAACAALTIGDSDNSEAILSFRSGSTLVIGGALTIGGGGGQRKGSIDMSAGGTLSIGAAVTITKAGTWTPGTGTVIYAGAGITLPNSFFTSYNNLTIAGSGSKTTGAALTVSGNLNVQAGTFATGANNSWTLAVTGTTAVSGTLMLANTSAKTFIGAVTINAGGAWNNSGGSAVKIRSGISNSGTFTAGGGIYTFDTTSAQSLAGNLSIPNMTINAPCTVTLNSLANLTCSTALCGGGGLTLAAGTGNSLDTQMTILNLGGSSDIATLNASANYTKVFYNGAGAQTVHAGTYYWLASAGGLGANVSLPDTSSGGVTPNCVSGLTLGGDVTVNYMLTLAAGALSIDCNTLTLNGAISQSGGTLVGGDSSNITFGGSGASTILPSVSLNNLTINRGSGISLGGDVTIDGVLTFTSGNIVTGGNQVIITSCGAVTRTSGHVVGNLQKPVCGTGTVNFEVGTGTSYTPLSVNFTAGCFSGATLTASSTAGLPGAIASSGISSTQYVNCYWTLAASGITSPTYTATFNFTSSDLVGNPAISSFIVRRYAPATWTRPPGTTSTAGNATTARGFTAFGNFVIGDPPSWISYQDPARTQPQETFNSSRTTVYMGGGGYYNGSNYLVAYYDASGVKRGSETSSGSGGSLTGAYLLTGDITASPGIWHALVQPASGYTAFGTHTYAQIIAAPDTYGLVSNDSFTAESSAIPEFPTVVAGIAVSGACAAIYWWMRRRKLAYAKA